MHLHRVPRTPPDASHSAVQLALRSAPRARLSSAPRAQLRSTDTRPDDRQSRPDAPQPQTPSAESVTSTFTARPTDAAEPEEVVWLRDAEALYGEGSRWVEWPRYKSRIHYVQQGTSGPPLLLVHGFGVGGYHFDRNIAQLAKRHRVWAVDLLGQGASWPLLPVEASLGLQYSIDTWVAQLAFFVHNVMQCEGGVYVAGNSLGGLLAVTLANLHPEVWIAIS
jgi:hypothetical protein